MSAASRSTPGRNSRSSRESELKTILSTAVAAVALYAVDATFFAGTYAGTAVALGRKIAHAFGVHV
jgi:hypothetical protein